MSKPIYRQVCITGSGGFTLIELLVVIAIIGILASIVLVSLSSARTKGADAGVQGNLNTIRTQAELYYSDNNTYGVFNGGSASPLSSNQSTGLCFTQASGNLFADPTIKAAIKSAQTATGSSVTCYSNGSAWAMAVGFRTTATQMWCIDSNGNATTISLISPSPVTTLNTNNGRCQ